MDKLVFVKFQFSRNSREYDVSTTFVLEPGMQLHAQLLEEQEWVLQQLAQGLEAQPQDFNFSSIVHLQIEDNEVADTEEAPLPVLRELQGIIAALDLLKDQLKFSSPMNPRHEALQQAEATMMRRLAEFGKPGG